MRNDRYLASADDSRLASQFSQYLISYALAAANISLPFAIKTRLTQTLYQALAHSFSRHFDEPKLAYLEDIRLCLVLGKRLLERVIDLLAVRGAFHVDEVDDDDPADIANAQLISNFAHGLEIDLQNRFLERVPPDEFPRIDVDSRERLGRIDDEVSATAKPHTASQRTRNLDFDPISVEDGVETLVTFDDSRIVGHVFLHEIANAIEFLRIVDDDFVDPIGHEVAHRSQWQIEFLVKETRCLCRLESLENVAP